MAGFGQKKAARAKPEKRKSERSMTSASATVLTTTSRGEVTVVDLSGGGAGLLAPNPPQKGRDVQLRIGGHTLFGAVAWRSDDAFGMNFEDILDAHDWATIDEVVKEAKGGTCNAHDGALDRTQNKADAERLKDDPPDAD